MSIADDPEYQKLKEGHKQFIANVMSGKTYTDSYKLVYPNASQRTAGNKGCILYNRYKDLINRNSPLDVDMVNAIANETIQNLKMIAFTDIADMIDPKTGKVLPPHRMPKATRIAITEVSVSGNKYKYVMGGKLKAMELLAKITKIDNTPSTEVNISISEAERDARIKEILVKAIGRDGDEE